MKRYFRKMTNGWKEVFLDKEKARFFAFYSMQDIVYLQLSKPPRPATRQEIDDILASKRIASWHPSDINYMYIV